MEAKGDIPEGALAQCELVGVLACAGGGETGVCEFCDLSSSRSSFIRDSLKITLSSSILASNCKNEQKLRILGHSSV